MTFFDDLPPYVPSPPPYAANASAAGTDAIDLSRQQFPVPNEPFIPNSPFNDHDDHLSPSKKTRISFSPTESTIHHFNAANAPVSFPQKTTMMPPPPPPAHHNTAAAATNANKVGSGTGHIFFKTRLCAKFRHGVCRNGEHCNFAHGLEDMRQPPPNWQEIVGLRGSGSSSAAKEERPAGNWDDDQKIIHKMKLCKKYYNGEECPYGEKCSFLHEDPAKFRDDSGMIRETSVISIGTNVSPKSYRDGSNNTNNTNAEAYTGVAVNAFRGNVKSAFWKTKLCTKWETTGNCPFGQECHFAHGESELHVPGGRAEVEAAGAIPIATYSTVPTLTKVPSIPVIAAGAYAGAAPPRPRRRIPSPPLANLPGEPGFPALLKKWKGPKKINGIYGDWPEDLPFDDHDEPSRGDT